MKILHVNCNYVGTTLHQHMIENLDDIGYENSVFVPTYDKNLSVITPNDNVCVCECFEKWDRILFDYKQQKILKAIESNYDIKEFDLIHAYTLFTDGNCAKNLSKKYGVPYVVAVRNTDVNDFFRLMPHLRSRGVAIMRKAKAVFFLSEAYRKQVFDKYIPKIYSEEIWSKSYIIPNGIDDFWYNNLVVESIKEEHSHDKEIKLIYVGRIDKNKNILTTQAAMKILRSKGYAVTLTVVGKVDDKKEFKKIKADKYTSYIPAKPKEELVELYRKHDIFVMPSYTESFGLVYAEALTQGLPVIYTKGQGFDNQFADGEVGFAVDANSKLSVAEAIIKIAQKYVKITKNIASKSKRFSWKTIIMEYDKVYRIIGGR